MNLLKNKKGQTSLEFSMVLLVIVLLSVVSIYNFLNDNFDEEDKTINKIEVGVTKAVSFVNSRVNGTYVKYPISYLGMSYNENKTNISIYIRNGSSVNLYTKNFINSTIYNDQNINYSKYKINIYYVD
ncbi:conserved hypothetical protein [Methanococcus aeolicus Nankai-3]|uniref:Class III signal peptide-containing protein n=1 Tax=Methanococcus aeolicus (strain ATCC BAA-1280 / DSM 17508 / OCM 812 / Nankai-3) TaxID=419665 RepID=A6UVD9_META3|nr:class III signal peptide-containing protein [Methanococcus aeolicus]ABR56461.1 conserved hypothetical protein [Methanococcus aeolicus Nankai-3]